MIAIAKPSINFTPDQQVKIKAAVKQMNQLLSKVDHWVKYRLLTRVDREQLMAQGFAQDLVDNLIYLTQRFEEEKPEYDKLAIGFTSEAFDPSLFACKIAVDALQKNTKGCCSWCESYLEHTQAQVSHYRPPTGYSKDKNLHRRSYYSLAYDDSNLLYACHTCSELYKADQFPTIDNQHVPDVKLEDEKPVLVNPYSDNPRDYIRFNPLNAMAYDFDLACRFYATQGKRKDEVEQFIWQDPAHIPLQKTAAGEAISRSEIDNAYRDWLEQNKTLAKSSRGAMTIQIVGLNRDTLVYARANHLASLCSQYSNNLSGSADETADEKTESQQSKELEGIQYRSLTLDAINTWQKATSAVSPATKE